MNETIKQTPMNILKRIKHVITLVLVCGASQAAVAACDQTLSPGANLASAVSSAPNGSTICLNSGDYGTVNFTNISRTGLVTLQSTASTGASMSPKISNSDFIRLQGMTLRNMSISACSTNIQVAGNTWAQNTSGSSSWTMAITVRRPTNRS